jgi:hypothetical protein
MTTTQMEILSSNCTGNQLVATLAEGSRIVIGRTKFSEEKKEVLRKMTMFDKVGVGTDWIEIKRQKEEYAAQIAQEKAIFTAKNALEMGLSLEQAAKLADLPLAEVEALVAIK